jgi:hypothetical protein
MAKARMDLSAFVGKLLDEQDRDVLRAGIRVLSPALMATEVAGLHRCGPPRARPRTHRLVTSDAYEGLKQPIATVLSPPGSAVACASCGI